MASGFRSSEQQGTFVNGKRVENASSPTGTSKPKPLRGPNLGIKRTRKATKRAPIQAADSLLPFIFMAGSTGVVEDLRGDPSLLFHDLFSLGCPSGSRHFGNQRTDGIAMGFQGQVQSMENVL
jgi:hypothetical protein